MNDSATLPRREISLLAVWQFVWRHKAVIAPCILASALAATGLAYALTPKYRAEVVFSPINSTGGFSSDLGGLGGLAALAGFSLGGAGKRAGEAIEYLRSREFTRQFIERHSLMPLLFARRWDARRNQWRGEPPTIAEAVERFSKGVRQITEDHRTGMVTLAIIWRDRAAAAQWANALVAEADAALRQRAIAEYTRSIDYLKAEAARGSVVELQTAIAKTMEAELKDAMIARTRDAYAFKIIDPAVVRDPKDTDSPNKPLVIALGAVFGLLVGVILAARRQWRARQREG